MFLSILIFMTMVILYMNLLYQWKRSDNLEVFQMDYVDNPRQLQDACDLRQPIVFHADFLPSGVAIPAHAAAKLSVVVKDARDYVKKGTLDGVDMTLERAHRFFESSPRHYFSEGNGDFLRDSGVLRQIQEDVDEWFRPPAYTVSSQYDLLFLGGAETPFRYHTHYRRFLWVQGGGPPLRVRLVPSMGQEVKDYEFYEFYSTAPAAPPNTVDVVVPVGHAIYIPPYWWYSVAAATEDATSSSTWAIQCSYVTVMNAAAHAKDLALYWLQQKNIYYVHANREEKGAFREEKVAFREDEGAYREENGAFREKNVTAECILDANTTSSSSATQQQDSGDQIRVDHQEAILEPRTMPEDVHREDHVGYVASCENLSLEHDIVQSPQGDGRTL